MEKKKHSEKQDDEKENQIKLRENKPNKKAKINQTFATISQKKKTKLFLQCKKTSTKFNLNVKHFFPHKNFFFFLRLKRKNCKIFVFFFL